MSKIRYYWNLSFLKENTNKNFSKFILCPTVFFLQTTLLLIIFDLIFYFLMAFCGVKTPSVIFYSLTPIIFYFFYIYMYEILCTVPIDSKKWSSLYVFIVITVLYLYFMWWVSFSCFYFADFTYTLWGKEMFSITATIVFCAENFILILKNIFWGVVSLIFLILPILLVIAFYTLSERKIMGAVQRRRGPNVTGLFGLLQPIADGVKLILKEPIIPRRANLFLFFLAPVITFSLSFCLWSILPTLFYFFLSDSNVGLLILFAISSLSIFGIMGAGWASNSKYALLGALRSASQMISYEIALGFIFLTVSLLAESVNLFDIFFSQNQLSNIFPLFPLSLIFFISSLAETNRAPFDLPEAEAEIVAGYNVEYSGITFALFFLGEYSNMFLMSLLFVFLFLGGNIGLTFFDTFIFIFKVSLIALLFIFVRAILPRVRYDQLMSLGWQVFLPFTLAYLIFIGSVFFVDDLFFYWDDVNYSLFFQDISKYF